MRRPETLMNFSLTIVAIGLPWIWFYLVAMESPTAAVVCGLCLAAFLVVAVRAYWGITSMGVHIMCLVAAAGLSFNASITGEQRLCFFFSPTSHPSSRKEQLTKKKKRMLGQPSGLLAARSASSSSGSRWNAVCISSVHAVVHLRLHCALPGALHLPSQCGAGGH